MPKSCGWDEALDRRLRASKTEAAREVLALAKDMYMGDAMALVIESLPASKTAQIRRWNDDWEEWCRWLEWEERGWKIREISSGIVGVLAPEGDLQENIPSDSSFGRPSEAVVAAAIDVHSTKFLGRSDYGGRSARRPYSRNPPQAQFLYKIR